ncbi:cupin domain-containing protein [Pseudobacillus wudalianchiensis]|uniref:cupin domain-containing protein n=1 Tax=Pseudobacillus wudalianchiensis TaxID=1743143 RepID=UPI00114759B3|nr:cupin domain-containing protein [Bacillus wudalianchiensis]
MEEYISFLDETFIRHAVKSREKSMMFVLNFQPGQSLPPHPHPNDDVYVMIWEGGGTFTIDSECFSAKKGNMIHCQNKEALSFANDRNENATLCVTLAKD